MATQGIATSQLLLAGGISLLLLFLILVLLLLFRRNQPKYDIASLFESINRRLDQIEGLSLQVGNLSDIFLIPHTRGGFGEVLLEELLKTWLPAGAYGIQHRFRSGVRVDAIVRLGPHLVAVDAKFPLESLKREFQNGDGKNGISSEVKRTFAKHIDDIAQKYIVPDEGTLSFALMYIPSERIYYEAFVKRETGLMADAVRKGVVPVSPGSLFLYLQTVAFGLKGFSFPEEQRKLARMLRQLRQDFDTFSRFFNLTGGHLKNMQKAYEESVSRFQRLDLMLQRIEEPADDESRLPSGK